MRGELQTVLLWGDACWVQSSDALRFDGSPRAIDAILAALREPESRIRLIYQPDSLGVAKIVSSRQGRLALGEACAREFPVVNDPQCAWSHEPFAACDGGFATTVYFEREPGRLGEFTRLLEVRRVSVESVWPLSTFLLGLSHLPEDWPYTTILLLHGNRACGYRRVGAVAPAVQHWHGRETIVHATAWLKAILAENPAESIALLLEDGDGMRLNYRFRFLGREKLICHLPEIYLALEADIFFPRHHPAQLIPPPPLLTEP